MASQCDCGNSIDIDDRSSKCRDCLRRQARAAIDPEELRQAVSSGL